MLQQYSPRRFTLAWEEKLGRLADQESLAPFAETGNYRCPLRLRGFGENPILFLSNAKGAVDAASKFCLRTTKQAKFVVCLQQEIEEQLRFNWVCPSLNSILIGASDLEAGLLTQDPLNWLARLIRKRFEPMELIPFNTSSPACGNMFFGRESELKQLIHLDQDHALCGIGGIGKSSLIEQMIFKLRQSRNPRYERIVHVDMIDCPKSLDTAADRIANAVHIDSRSQFVGLNGLLAHLKQCRKTLPQFEGGPIELIIDEIDQILILDRLHKDEMGAAYPFMRALRNARHARPDPYIRLTFSGREQTRHLLNDPENPFSVSDFHGDRNRRFRLIDLQPFDHRSSWTLIRDPLWALGCLEKIPQHRLMHRILKCEGHPVQLQKLGQDLCVELVDAD